MTWNNGLIEKYDLIMLNLPVVAEAGIELSRRITVPEVPEEIIYSGNSFTAVYAGIAYRLATEVYLSSRSGCKIKAIALWDTGASATLVSADVVRKLNSQPVKTEKECLIVSPNNITEAKYHKLELEIPGIKKYGELTLANYDHLDDQHIDILIGMDIISEGVLTIDNSNGQTKLTFKLTDSD